MRSMCWACGAPDRPGAGRRRVRRGAGHAVRGAEADRAADRAVGGGDRRDGRQAGHVHADETSWQVFEDIEDKDGHRWWLWVFVTDQTTVFVMDTSRSAGVAARQLGTGREQSQLGGLRRLVISPDFHKACQSLACIDGVDPLWCFAQYAEPGIMRNGAALGDRACRYWWS